MHKLFFYLLIPILSLSSLPALSGVCAGSGQALEWRPDGEYDTSFLNVQRNYTSNDTGPVGAITLVLTRNFTCGADYQDPVVNRSYSHLFMDLNSGLQCKGNGTLAIANVPGLEWEISGVTCSGNRLRSESFVSTVTTDQRDPYWQSSVDPKIRAVLKVTDEYWKYNSQGSRRLVDIPLPSVILNRSNITIGPKAKTSLVLSNVSACNVTLSPENLDFGRLSPNDIKKGITKSFYIDYACSNKSIINDGLKIQFSPQYPVNPAQGTFAAKDNNNNMLIFQLFKLWSDGNHKFPLLPPPPTGNNPYGVLHNADPGSISARETFTIQTMPSTSSYPSGRVSTYLNIVLTYR